MTNLWQVRDRLLSLRKYKKATFDIIQGSGHFSLSVALGVDKSTGYGLTETSPTTHVLPVESANSKVGSIGVLVRNVKARIVVDDDGAVDARPGERGELWLHGPNIMKVRDVRVYSCECWCRHGIPQGYLGNKAATEESITPDGWFKTGDVAILDSDGFYWIVDRKKELIKYKVCVDAIVLNSVH